MGGKIMLDREGKFVYNTYNEAKTGGLTMATTKKVKPKIIASWLPDAGIDLSVLAVDPDVVLASMDDRLPETVIRLTVAFTFPALDLYKEECRDAIFESMEKVKDLIKKL